MKARCIACLCFFPKVLARGFLETVKCRVHSVAMPARTSSRVYTSQSLEAWFDHVTKPWEAFFSEDALRQGRELYRNGKISGVELGDKDAIVHCAFARKDTCYAVIEWNGKKGPEVRASTKDAALGSAVAVGGLYEIEELIADEITPIPKDGASAEGRGDEGDAGCRGDAETDSEDIAPERPAWALVPRLEGGRSGLRLSAFWVSDEGVRVAAFQSGAMELVSAEREVLVRLTGRAKEAGFRYRREAGDFLLDDVERIEPFFCHTLKRWKASFGSVELDEEANRMAEGVRPVEVVGRAAPVGRDRVQVDWRLRLGRRWLDPEDAERLARAGQGTHIVKGLGLARINEEQSNALRAWEVAREDKKTWPRYMLFSLFGERGAELNLEDALRQWREALVSPEDGSLTELEALELPEFLRSYQAHGVRWMANLRDRGCHGLLADEMGLGKTLQVLTLLRARPFEGRSNLIVCPASVAPVWEREAAHWFPEFRTAVLRHGNTFGEGMEQADDGVDLWIASYTQLRRHKHLLESERFGYAVLDEAQQIKNPDAKVTHACCAIRAECRLALTGTPLENRLLDLWTIFRYLMPGLLGTRARFEEAVMQNDAEAREAFEQRLRTQIAPFLLRRCKDSVGGDLPAKVEMDLICPITEMQQQVYRKLLERGLDELDGDLESAARSRPIHVFALLTRLRQVCCDPGLIPGGPTDVRQSGKIEMLLTRLAEAIQGNGSRKIVVFSQFVELLKRLRPVIHEEFPDVSVYELTGASRDRAAPVEGFQNEAGPAVILVSLRAGGTGITLHAADYVFLLDPWWNPAVENQAIDRVHRIGQQHRVFVYRMITQDTIEERIQNLQEEKRNLFSKTLESSGEARELGDHFDALKELAELLPAERR